MEKEIMTINAFANICGYFYNSTLNSTLHNSIATINNGYNCKHKDQEEVYDGIGCCYQFSCPLAIAADEEDCEKYGYDFEDGEFVLVETKLLESLGWRK